MNELFIFIFHELSEIIFVVPVSDTHTLVEVIFGRKISINCGKKKKMFLWGGIKNVFKLLASFIENQFSQKSFKYQKAFNCLCFLIKSIFRYLFSSLIRKPLSV